MPLIFQITDVQKEKELAWKNLGPDLFFFLVYLRIGSQGTCVSANFEAANTNIFGSGITFHPKSLAADNFLAFSPSFLQISHLFSFSSSKIISFLYIFNSIIYIVHSFKNIFTFNDVFLFLCYQCLWNHNICSYARVLCCISPSAHMFPSVKHRFLNWISCFN